MDFENIIHRWLRIPYVLKTHIIAAPKNPRATVILLHGIGSSSLMWQKSTLKKHLDADIQIIAVDLLGFGDSPKPDWKKYSTSTQAKSLLATLIRQKITGPTIIVGHSLGSLVAVEYAHLMPKIAVRGLVLCSPPIYNSSHKISRSEAQLKQIYQQFINMPTAGKILISDLARQYRFLNPGFKITKDNAKIFIDTLDAAIINQDTAKKIKNISQPIDIIYGNLDPVIISKNIKNLAHNKNINVQKIIAGHEVTRAYARTIAASIQAQIDQL